MSENSKPQDPAVTAAPESAPEKTAPETTVPANKVTDTAVPEKGARRAAGHASAEPARSQSASQIKLDPGFDPEQDPMRPASRFPKMSDEGDAETASPDKTTPETQAPPVPAAQTPGVAAGEDDATAKVEQTTTDMISMRPPAEEVARRQAAMEKAANTKPVLTRVFQVLIAAFYPIVLLVLSIRLVTTSVFLWIEYHRPGFAADPFGFTTDDRVTYGSYTVDYLLNFAGPRYLGDLVDQLGNPLFLAREVQHMADVKTLIDMAFLLGLTLAIVIVIGLIYLSKRSFGGIRRSLFAGSIVTLVLIVAMGAFALSGWEAFFTDFHEVFFANGTWTFYTDDTLIRLFPSQFWSDAGIFIGVFVLMVSSLTMALTWPTKDRRRAASVAKRPGRRAA